MRYNLTSIIHVNDQPLDNAAQLVKSCVNFAVSGFNYSTLMISYPDRPGMMDFMAEMKQFLAKKYVSSEIWIPEQMMQEDVYHLIASVIWKLSNYVIIQDIPLDHSQAQMIIRAAEILTHSPRRVYFQKPGFFKKDFHVALMHHDMLNLAFGERNYENILSGKPDSVVTFLQTLERAAKKNPNIKTEYLSL